MAEIGLPYRNTLWYYRQSDYTTCPSQISSDTALPIGCEWRVGEPSMEDKHAVNYGAAEAVPTTLWEQVDDYKFRLEYVPQCSDTLLSDIINRDAYGYLKSLAFMLGVNVDLAADADKSWYQICGCKADTIRLSSSFNNK